MIYGNSEIDEVGIGCTGETKRTPKEVCTPKHHHSIIRRVV
jgi:hypothetical protein